MKKLLLIPLAVLLVGAGFVAHQPQTKVVKQAVTTVKTQTVQAQTKLYGIGDTQDGITLLGEYHTSYQNMRSANPTINVVAFALSGVSQDQLWQNSAILTDSGFSRANGLTVPECRGNPCAVFEITNPTEFHYLNLVWNL